MQSAHVSNGRCTIHIKARFFFVRVCIRKSDYGPFWSILIHFDPSNIASAKRQLSSTFQRLDISCTVFAVRGGLPASAHILKRLVFQTQDLETNQPMIRATFMDVFFLFTGWFLPGFEISRWKMFASWTPIPMWPSVIHRLRWLRCVSLHHEPE